MIMSRKNGYFFLYNPILNWTLSVSRNSSLAFVPVVFPKYYLNIDDALEDVLSLYGRVYNAYLSSDNSIDPDFISLLIRGLEIRRYDSKTNSLVTVAGPEAIKTMIYLTKEGVHSDYGDGEEKRRRLISAVWDRDLNFDDEIDED